MTVIRSRANPQVKQLVALAHSARDRKKAGLTVLDGEHLVSAYLDAVGIPQSVLVAESALESARELLARLPVGIVSVLDDKWLKEASALDSPAGVMALVPTPAAQAPSLTTDAVLVMEDVQDPGNVGSMLRSAAAAGVTDVVLSPTCAFAWSPKVLRAAQGAHFTLNIAEGIDAVAYVKAFKGQAVALVLRATQTIYGCDLRLPTAFLVGNEGVGLSTELQSAAARCVAIPMPGRVESLKVAAAAAIALFEAVRQRQS